MDVHGKSSVLGVPVDRLTMEQAVARVEEFIREGGFHLVATANAEMVMLAGRDAAFREILQNAAMVVGDGTGVVWAAKYLGEPLPQKVAGIELMHALLQVAARKGYRVFLCGAAPDVVKQAVARIKEKYRGIDIAGYQHGYFRADEETAIIEHINSVKPHILFVALGVPKQEKWLARHAGQLRVPVGIGVGGSFDIFAGIKQRAPQWMCNSGLEWLYRLCKEPTRIGRMMALPRFVLAVVLRGKRRRT